MRFALIVLSLALLSGCYNQVAIRKDQLPLLNGSYQRVTGAVRTGDQTVYTGEITVAHVAAPDGRNVEIKGEFDATIKTADGTSTTFEHPVTSTLQAGTLGVTGANRAATKFELAKVNEVTVSQYDGNATFWAYFGTFLAATAAVSLITLAVID